MARSPPRADVDFFLAITVGGGDRAGWGDDAGAARATGSDWRRPDRDSSVHLLVCGGDTLYPLLAPTCAAPNDTCMPAAIPF